MAEGLRSSTVALLCNAPCSAPGHTVRSAGPAVPVPGSGGSLELRPPTSCGCVTRGPGRAEAWSPGSPVAAPAHRSPCALPLPAQVAEGGPAREPLPPLEVSPRKRLPAAPEPDPCGGRPAPEGAGAGAEQGHSAGGGWCRHCHTKLAELKRQAWKLVSGPGTPLRDPRLSALLLDKLPALPDGRPEAERRCCALCTASLGRHPREALQPLPAPTSPEEPGGPHGGSSATTSTRDLPGAGSGRPGPERWRGPAWPPGPSVQVSVVPAGLGGALSTVTIQAQPCPEGTWSVSRANSFLPPSCLAEAAVAAVAVADTVRDACPTLGPGSVSRGSPGPSAATSFFIRCMFQCC
ncbi:kinesin-like protein KIF26A [Choloepus didactylus]|uniref:kinesin-like protein KIF26A n=1 Tax=Choloepus didactylus TaxID=27675 RepID=UPI00189D8900|nr:kinesin-like protein KIF26A [Choloepus didactylus]